MNEIIEMIKPAIIMETKDITQSSKVTEIKDMTQPSIISIENLSIAYDKDKLAVKDVTATIKKNAITAIMGPSGCGKTTLLRAINRMHELYPNISTTGEIKLFDESIYEMSTIQLRRKIGMVFQRPNPFPTLSIYENVIAGYKLNGIRLKRNERDEIVETSLKDVTLWDEVKNSLHKKGNFLSGGQQQRLCIARGLAFKPDVILLDEPTSALDPIATSKIEDLLIDLKENYTIVLVTHNMSQAARISDNSMYMYLGELIEYDTTTNIFTNPKNISTQNYITGRFG
jgi:phosphate transport system ATP-binding protein